jgi:predicted membrane GTPase involved in stress response
MANGKKIPDSVRKKIIAFYTNEHTMRQTSTKFKVSISAVKNIIHEARDTDKHGDFVQKVAQIKKNNVQDILDTLADDDTKEIITKYKKQLKLDANITGAIMTGYKLQFLTNTIGMFYDKALKYKALEDGIGLLGDGISIKVVNDAR